MAEDIAKVREIPPKESKKMFAEHKDKNKEVYFARNTDQRIQALEARGYTVAKADEIAKTDGRKAEDGTVKYGDTIAMVIDKKTKDERFAEKQAIHEQLMEQQAKGDRKLGVGTYRENGRRKGTKFYSIP